MEYVDGLNLKELLLKNGKLETNLIQKIAQKLLEGIKYLHDNKIIHRDIKVKFILT